MKPKKLADLNPRLRPIMRELLRRVGITGERAESFQFVGEWYKQHAWTAKQQDGWRKWMVRRWSKRWGKQAAEREAAWLVLMYGWRVED